MATNATSNTIVPFLLELKNYKPWTIFLKNYLLTQDLWDVVETGDALPSADWSKRNAAALHAIHITCSQYVFVQIKDIGSAKDAWNKLAEMHQMWKSHSRPNLETSSVSFSIAERHTAMRLVREITREDWDTVHGIFQEYPYTMNAIINDSNETALHVAVWAGSVKIAEELIPRLSEPDLEKQDMNGNTALSFAASAGRMKIARCLVEKNRTLLTIPNKGGFIPVVLASAVGDKYLTKYLYSETPAEFLSPASPDGGKHGLWLLNYTITGKMFDISLNLLQNYPSLAVIKTSSRGDSPILTLSNEPSAFFSGSILGFWQRLIYHCIKINQHSSSNYVRISVPHQDQNEQENIMQVFFRLGALDLMFLKFSGIKKIYDLKLIHTYSLEVLKCMCEHITILSRQESLAGQVYDAFFQATKNGMEEFVVEVLKARPHIMYSYDQNLRIAFMCAVEYRQEKIFSFFCSVAAWKHLLNHTDNHDNNCLHIAGMLAPDFQLARISGAALQMQRELQWFKSQPGILSVLPELKYELRTTWTLEFLGLDKSTDLFLE
ncbi:hypothetical protein SLEP1_g7620 [Rubroshorea leprosula]|uniref:DUF4219 domain-containing protein n=1 Tax=Rubroshorea leprosula TaxID=152421 RepID=A0AAV5I8W9_9ROSI|nr:hypothetical protein SLEP1_g7620 [Rubroshorea leprosula]